MIFGMLKLIPIFAMLNKKTLTNKLITMKTVKVTLALLVILFSFTNLFSQVTLDTIYKKSGKIMVVKVTEVLPDVVKYVYHNGADSIIMGVDREELKKIAFANGAVQSFIAEMINPEHYADQHKSDLKMDFLAPTLYHVSIAYERSIKPGMSWESGVSIIGIGNRPEDYRTTNGAIMSGGLKFMLSPDYYASRQHYAHILKGGYIRIQGYLGYYTESYASYLNSNNNGYYYTQTPFTEKDNYTVGALHIQFGKQYIFDNIFLFDIYAGLGYDFVSVSSNNPDANNYTFDASNNGGYYYNFLGLGGSVPLSLSAGMRIGILF